MSTATASRTTTREGVASAHPDLSVLAAAEQDRLAMRAVENYHRADMDETWLSDGSGSPHVVMLRDHSRPRFFSCTTEEDHFWLVVDGVAVAYLHTMTHFERETHQQVLCDIEVRDGYRGHGYARTVIAAAQDALGDTLHTTGGFTPLGAQALAWLPVLPGYTAGVKFDPMPFVEDWDNLIPINPL